MNLLFSEVSLELDVFLVDGGLNSVDELTGEIADNSIPCGLNVLLSGSRVGRGIINMQIPNNNMATNNRIARPIWII